jgi:hypothetical protein
VGPLSPGTYTIRSRIKDKDGGFSEYFVTFIVEDPSI